MLFSKKDKCLSALFLTHPHDDRHELKTVKGKRVQGTCQWVTTNEAITSWLASPTPLLWISSGPGKGKTMLSIFLTEELERNAAQLQLAAVVYFFCDSTNHERNTAVAVLRGLIYQLIELHPSLLKHILPVFEDQGEDLFRDSSLESLWRVFESMVRDELVGSVFCVLDGLDECKEHSLEILAKKLRSFFLRSPHSLRLIAVSQELPDCISRTLSGIPHVRLDLDSEHEGNDDLRKFIAFKVKKLFTGNSDPNRLRKSVEESLFKRAMGNFLWVDFAMEELVKKTLGEVEDCLNDLPTGLEGMYKRMLLHIPQEGRAVAASILRWVVMAIRPMTLAELGAAIGIGSSKAIRDHIGLYGNFITVNGDNVSLVHQSAKTYLLNKDLGLDPQLECFCVKEDETHTEIARTCFNYLHNGALADGGISLADRDDKGIPRLLAFPLLPYSVLYWPEHARYSNTLAEDIFDLSNPFYKKKSSIRQAWLTTHFSATEKRTDPFSLLHLASFFGLVPLASKLLKKGWTSKLKFYSQVDMEDGHVDMKDGLGRSPLFYAADNGQEAIVQLLLKAKADANTKDGFERTVLHRAAQNGYNVVVHLLLNAGAEVDKKDRSGLTALHRAAENGHGAVVKLLLKAKSEVKTEDKSGWTALHRAANSGHDAVVQLLLEARADVNMKDGSGWTSLHRAAWNGHEALVQRLLEARADVNAKTNFGWTALYGAARNGHDAVVQLLLEAKAEVNAKDRSGRTALHVAVWNRHDAVVRSLLAAKAEVNAKNNYPGATALHIAAVNGHDVVVQQLLEAKAEVDAKDGFGGTALYAAAAVGHLPVVKLLLEAKADINARDNCLGRTPLHKAVEMGHDAVVELLLAAKADVNAKDNFFGRTTLHVAAEVGDQEIVPLLLEAKAEINAKDSSFGATALHVAVINESCAVIQTLLEAKVAINAKDAMGSTALHLAAEGGDDEIVQQLLLEPNTEINAKNSDGKTALYMAQTNGHEAVVRLLRTAMARPIRGRKVALPRRPVRRGDRRRRT
jgi:ankyrin repeat protein